MARRGRKADLKTDSDSFLDIIANIVGVLIILLVVAGVRVSQLPATRPKEEPVLASSLSAHEAVLTAVEPPVTIDVQLGG